MFTIELEFLCTFQSHEKERALADWNAYCTVYHIEEVLAEVGMLSAARVYFSHGSKPATVVAPDGSQPANLKTWANCALIMYFELLETYFDESSGHGGRTTTTSPRAGEALRIGEHICIKRHKDNVLRTFFGVRGLDLLDPDRRKYLKFSCVYDVQIQDEPYEPFPHEHDFNIIARLAGDDGRQLRDIIRTYQCVHLSLQSKKGEPLIIVGVFL